MSLEYSRVLRKGFVCRGIILDHFLDIAASFRALNNFTLLSDAFFFLFTSCEICHDTKAVDTSQVQMRATVHHSVSEFAAMIHLKCNSATRSIHRRNNNICKITICFVVVFYLFCSLGVQQKTNGFIAPPIYSAAKVLHKNKARTIRWDTGSTHPSIWQITDIDN